MFSKIQAKYDLPRNLRNFGVLRSCNLSNILALEKATLSDQKLQWTILLYTSLHRDNDFDLVFGNTHSAISSMDVIPNLLFGQLLDQLSLMWHRSDTQKKVILFTKSQYVSQAFSYQFWLKAICSQL